MNNTYQSYHKSSRYNISKDYTEQEEFKVGLDRHFPPSNKEWKDSVYSYNRNYLMKVPFNHNQTNRIVRDYFNIHGRKSIARSKRMRSRLIRFSSRKIYVSTPEIKLNNDKTIVTVYTYDRERQLFIRKLFFFWRKPILYNSWLMNNSQENTKLLKPKNIISYMKSKRKSVFDMKRRRHMNVKHSLYGTKFSNELDFLTYRTLDLHKRFLILDNLMSQSFVHYLLSLFNINIATSSNKENDVLSLLNKHPQMLLLMNNKSNMLSLVKNDCANKELVKSISDYDITDTKGHKKLLVNYIWKFIENNFINTGIITNEQIVKLYKDFTLRYYRNVVHKLYSTEARLFYNYSRININKLKFTDLTSLIKTLISRLYNKTTELNIVNLKYIHLNGDLFTEAIASKLRKRAGLVKVLRKSLKLVKTPTKFNLHQSDIRLSRLNKYNYLNIDKLVINVRKGTDKLNDVMMELFSNNFVHKSNNSLKSTDINTNKINKVLNSVKFKWVGGLRLEAAGRLTRRNTASRSVFKIRYKGNLKNKQYYIDSGLARPMPVVTLRNHAKINTQYSFTKSKRRIGSFGLKSWISGY